MAQIGVGFSPAEKTQRIYARMAGFLFLWLIVTGVGGLLMESHIVGSGTFAETAKRVVASEHLYRFALCTQLVETMSALVLAFALYVTLKPVDQLLAQIAMYWRLGESFIGGVGVMFGSLRLHLYTSQQSNGGAASGQAEALVDLLGHAGSDVSAIFFSIGSILFFYLFFKSRYIPRIISAFGLFASALVTMMLFGSLVFPEHASKLMYGWAPMAIAEVATGIWLMLFAVKTRVPDGPLLSSPTR